MTLENFVAESKLDTLTETQKSCHLAFYFFKKSAIDEFSASDCAKWFDDLRLSKPNATRLGTRLKESRDTIRGSKSATFRLHHSYVKTMEDKFPQLCEKSQEITNDGTILPKVLYENSRGYIESLSKQINASYENNIFDGCAVLMRRLEEILLILSYEKLGIATAIKDGNGNYFMLESIVRDAEKNGTLNLSRNGKKTIETIRELGNYSAHKITYTCKREYIRETANEYRALIDELLHKSGIRI